jgi:hypothetical protein
MIQAHHRILAWLTKVLGPPYSGKQPAFYRWVPTVALKTKKDAKKRVNLIPLSPHGQWQHLRRGCANSWFISTAGNWGQGTVESVLTYCTRINCLPPPHMALAWNVMPMVWLKLIKVNPTKKIARPLSTVNGLEWTRPCRGWAIQRFLSSYIIKQKLSGHPTKLHSLIIFE